jgi:hypothetical protein
MPGNAEPGEPRRFPSLSPWETVGILAIAVTHFLFGMGPIWRHPWEPNASIVWSYVPLPFLVLVVLLVRKRWSLAVWAFDTFRVAVFKFFITALILVGLWSTTEPTAKPPPVAPATTGEQTMTSAVLMVPATKSAPKTPTPLDEATLGTIEGTASPGGLVYVSTGLEGFVFAPPPTNALLVHDGKGFSPSTLVVLVGQRLEVRSSDKKLHTFLAAETGGRQLLSAPLVAMSERTIVFTEPTAPLTVHCAVHAGEASAQLLVLSHPFFALASAEGTFHFARVPAGKLRVRSGAVEKEAVVSAGVPARVTLR